MEGVLPMGMVLRGETLHRHVSGFLLGEAMADADIGGGTRISDNARTEIESLERMLLMNDCGLIVVLVWFVVRGGKLDVELR